jgi:DNA invertase Pin-like site-specific DNA recombinase
MIIGYIKITKNDFISREEDKKALEEYARQNHLVIDNFIQSTCFCSRDFAKIKAGDLLLMRHAQALGKSFGEVLQNVQLLYAKGIDMFFLKENLDIRVNASYSFTDVTALCLELNKAVFSIRNKTIQDNLLKQGLKRGRPFGVKNKKTIFTGKDSFIRKSLLAGMPKAELARRVGCSRPILYGYLKRNNISYITQPNAFKRTKK